MIDSKNENRSSADFEVRARGAFLGAALGDAMGWPQEFPRRISDGAHLTERPIDAALRSWTRKNGLSYQPHEERIEAGEYSDDTQLLLCTARSLIRSSRWWIHFAKVELPIWLAYQRGGGSATKRSAKSWADGHAPWDERRQGEDIRGFFEAGANGVAMRILPHCLRSTNIDGFSAIAKEIVANGVCTHGHPRALVGALAYGYAVWKAIHRQGILEYGGLLSELIQNVEEWSTIPDIGDIWPEWPATITELYEGRYSSLWADTTDELVALFRIGHDGMRQGALAVDHATLDQLGCFGKEKGSGTITTAAAVFLASRYASDPITGVIEGAYAAGADTDTLASMTGGLLGAIAGTDWFSDTAKGLQDAAYIQELVEALVLPSVSSNDDDPAAARPIRKTQVDSIRRALEAGKTSSLRFPDGRAVAAVESVAISSLSNKIKAQAWRLKMEDGQTLYIKSIKKNQNRGVSESSATSRDQSPVNGTKQIRSFNVQVQEVLFSIPVSDWEKTRSFYEDVLGLSPTEDSRGRVRYEQVILLRKIGSPSAAAKSSIPNSDHLSAISMVIKVNETSFYAIHDRVKRCGGRIVRPLANHERGRFFECADPEGNFITIRYDQPVHDDEKAMAAPTRNDSPLDMAREPSGKMQLPLN